MHIYVITGSTQPVLICCPCFSEQVGQRHQRARAEAGGEEIDEMEGPGEVEREEAVGEQRAPRAEESQHHKMALAKLRKKFAASMKPAAGKAFTHGRGEPRRASTPWLHHHWGEGGGGGAYVAHIRRHCGAQNGPTNHVAQGPTAASMGP